MAITSENDLQNSYTRQITSFSIYTCYSVDIIQWISFSGYYSVNTIHWIVSIELALVCAALKRRSCDNCNVKKSFASNWSGHLENIKIDTVIRGERKQQKENEKKR